jgi:hypothetical protein
MVIGTSYWSSTAGPDQMSALNPSAPGQARQQELTHLKTFSGRVIGDIGRADYRRRRHFVGNFCSRVELGAPLGPLSAQTQGLFAAGARDRVAWNKPTLRGGVIVLLPRRQEHMPCLTRRSSPLASISERTHSMWRERRCASSDQELSFEGSLTNIPPVLDQMQAS